MTLLDYSDAHQHVWGVLTASYAGTDGVEVTAAAKVKKIEFNAAAFGASGVYNVESTDQAFAMWSDGMGSTVPQIGGSLTISGVVWNVTAIAPGRGDGAQWMVIGRQE